MAQNITWNTKRYLQFDQARLQPALDLISRISLDDPKHIVDLGCGPGHVTNIVSEWWPEAKLQGVDNSPDMLAKAQETYPHIDFQHQDLNQWAPDVSYNLIFSNAALHWLDDHEQLFPSLINALDTDSIAAIQMPRNWQAPSHALINETIYEGPWRDQLEPLIKPAPSKEPSFYYDILQPSTSELYIWETEYIQVLDGENPVAEFVKGSWLQRYLQVLEDPDKTSFENLYREKILKAYPKQKDGKTLFPFRRLFIVAVR